jgi:hypothetical protein
MHAWVGREAAARHGIPPSEFRLTDEERLLRDLAYPLIAPPYDRHRWYSVLNEYGLTQIFRRDWWYFDRTVYATHLFFTPTRSPSAIYGRLTDDIRDDIARVGPFIAAARRVADLDRKREKSLGFVSALAPEEESNALRRVAENSLIVVWVQQSLIERIASYRFALERLVISVPSQLAVNAERALTLLQQQVAAARVTPARPVALAGPVSPLAVKN